MNDKDGQKKNKERKDAIENAGLAASAEDIVNRYGGGIKEHIVGYSGIDQENRIELNDGSGRTIPTKNNRPLRKISSYKRAAESDPNYKSQTKNQAGFSAEVKEVTRRRAEEAIRGKKPQTMRTDDILKRNSNGNVVFDSEGNPIRPHVNHQLFDITLEVDAKGNPVPHSSAQMKFEGSTPDQAVGKLLSKSHEKYIDNDVKMVVPSDYYDGMKQNLDERISSLEKQVDSSKQQGKTEVAAVKQKQLEKCQKLKKNLRKSKLSNKEAIEARNNPALSTANDILKVGHQAGLEQAGTCAIVGGSMSLISNIHSAFTCEKSPEDAAKDIVLDTAKCAGASYTVTFVASIFKGMMQNSASETVRTLSKTNLPAYIVTSTIEVSKTLSSFFAGKIDGVQCLEQLGEKGYGMTVSALFMAIGQFFIPIPVVGALAGGMIGYAMSSVSYGILLGSLKNAKLAHEEYIRVKRECDEAVKMIREYRKELEEKIEEYLHNERTFFEECFSGIKEAFDTGDIDGFIGATNQITESCGKPPLYPDMEKFETIMTGDDPVPL